MVYNIYESMLHANVDTRCGGIIMVARFSKPELIRSREFRILSQRALAQKVQEHDKLGILFADHELEAVMLSYDRYETLMARLAALEEAVDDLQWAHEFGSHTDVPLEDWVSHPAEVSTEALYRQRRAQRG